MSRRRAAWVGAGLAAAALAIALHAPGLMGGPTLDAAVFTVVADGIRHGALPYRDTWDHKPPGIYALLAATQAVLPFVGPWVATWIASVAVVIGIGLATALLTADQGDRWAVAAGLTVVAYVGVFPIALGGGQTEQPAVLCALAAMLAASRGAPFVAGLAVGAGLVISFQVLPTAAGIALVVLLVAQAGGRARPMVRYVAGGLVVPAMALAWIVASGLGPSSSSAIIVYNAIYASMNRLHPEFFIRDALSCMLFAIPLLVLGIPTGVRAVRRLRPPIQAGAAIWVVGTVAFAVLQVRFEPHYLAATAPALVILAAGARPPQLHNGRSGRVLCASLAAVAVGLGLFALSDLSVRTSGNQNPAQVSAAARFLADHAGADASIFVWGNEPELYLQSQLGAGAPYVYVLPLTTPGYADRERIERLVDDMRGAKPAYIVDAGSLAPGEAGIVPLLVPRPVLEGDGRDADVIDPLREFVREHYDPPVEVAGWLFYPARDW